MSAVIKADRAMRISVEYEAGAGGNQKYEGITRFDNPAQLYSFFTNPSPLILPVERSIRVYGLAIADLQQLFLALNTCRSLRDVTLVGIHEMSSLQTLMIPTSLERLNFLYCADKVNDTVTKLCLRHCRHVGICGLTEGMRVRMVFDREFHFHRDYPNRLPSPNDVPQPLTDFPSDWF